MPLTLAQAKALSQDKLTDIVIDEFRKSPLMDLLPFDNTVKPQGGKSLAYVYNRVTTQPTAGARAINGEYTAQETVTEQKVVNLRPLGGSYEIDRVIAEDETQVVNEVEFQSAQKAKATVAAFCDLAINGDSATDTKEFDGIDKIISGTTSEFVPATAIALDSADNIKANYNTFLYELRKAQGSMDGAANIILVNSDMYNVFQTLSDIIPNIKFERNELGDEIVRYGSAQIVKMGDKAGTSTPIIANEADGTTSIYLIRTGLDGVHGVSPEGNKVIKAYAPNMQAAGAVKTGEVEFVGALAVKSTKAVAALRNIKVAAASESN